MRAKKDLRGKRPLSLVPAEGIYMAAEAMQAGITRKKNPYKRDDWRKGRSHSLDVDAALRHLMDYKEGRRFDKESGKNAIGHAIADLCILAHNIIHHPDLDDLPKEPSPKQF